MSLKRLGSKLTYSNIVSTICLFAVLGGGAYAATNLPKNSVGTKQLKRGAVTGVKVKDGSLEGIDLDVSTIGKVGSAAHADDADRAGHAERATLADSAKTSSFAAEATDAETLEGFESWAYRDHCQLWPFHLIHTQQGLCVSDGDLEDRDMDWEEAINECASRAMRLPGPGEAAQLRTFIATQNVEYWTDDFSLDEGTEMALAYSYSGSPDPATGFEAHAATDELRVRCVGPISNWDSFLPKPEPAFP